MKFESLSAAAAEATDWIINNQKQRLYIIFLCASNKVDRLSIKKLLGFFTALNSAEALTVHRHNKGNFSHLPVRDTLSTYPSAGLTNEKGILPCGFIVCVRATSGQSSLTPSWGLAGARQVEILQEKHRKKNQLTHKKKGGGDSLMRSQFFSETRGSKFQTEQHTSIYFRLHA